VVGDPQDGELAVEALQLPALRDAFIANISKAVRGAAGKPRPASWSALGKVGARSLVGSCISTPSKHLIGCRSANPAPFAHPLSSLDALSPLATVALDAAVRRRHAAHDLAKADAALLGMSCTLPW